MPFTAMVLARTGAVPVMTIKFRLVLKVLVPVTLKTLETVLSWPWIKARR
jgi:hypothetical protein